MKKVMSFILAAYIAITGVVSTGYADQTQVNDTEVQVYQESGATVTETTTYQDYDEAIEFLINERGYTADEATQMLGPVNTRSTRATSIMTKTKVYDWEGFEVELGGMWNVYSEGSFREATGLLDKWCDAVGTGEHTWSSFALVDATGSYPAVNLVLKSEGQIVIPVSNSATSSLGVSLEGIGFTVGDTVGTVTYYRKRESLTLRVEMM
jgi:hypothetical protein